MSLYVLYVKFVLKYHFCMINEVDLDGKGIIRKDPSLL